ncbi:ABC transporter permease [Kribbella catacumbae]|uniref:ABC transporter permease n=1 Tax=Kribbella catacumbae TaxID=460086 RepID=UPI0003A66A42|nr:ABC transporter permease [Kribbella catacumbae]
MSRAAVPRMLLRGWAIQVKDSSSFGFFIMSSLIEPVIFAAIAAYMFRAGNRPDALLYAAIGAGMLGVWIVTLIGSGQALTFLRHAGILELLIVAPVPFVLVLAPITLAAATVGMYSLAATLVWGWLLFDVPLGVEHPWLLLASVPATVIGLGMLGMLMASVFVLFRHANALTNMLGYPVWLASGFLVPVSLLPDWVRPVSWLLPTTWGAEAIRTSMIGGHPLPAIGACLGLAIGYFALAALTVRHFERLARQRASLALA